MRTLARIGILTAVIHLCGVIAAHASPLRGTFTAEHECEAFVSTKTRENSGGIHLATGTTYPVLAENKPGGDWIQLRVSGADPQARWVLRDCGTLSEQAATAPAAPTGNVDCSKPGLADSYVLALSWQPGFCEHFPFKTKKPECDDLADGDLVIDDHLTIHGLWPNRAECTTHYGNCGGPPLSLKPETVQELTYWMPNVSYTSEDPLAVHEWNTHGTCQALADDDYFHEAIQLAELVQSSVLGTFIPAHVGGSLQQSDLRRQIDGQLGTGASDRVALQCSKGFLIEVRVSLPKDPDPALGLAKLLAAAPVRPPGDCPETVKVEKSGR